MIPLHRQPAPLSPLGLPNLVAWWSSDFGVTSALGAVSLVADRSGNGYDLAQAGAGLKPTLVSSPGVHGKPVIVFDGADDYLKCAIAGLVQPITVYMAYRIISVTAFDRLFDGNASNSCGIYMTALNRLSMTAGTDVSVTDTYDVLPGTTTVIAAVFDSAQQCWLDADKYYPVAAVGATNPGGFTLGARGNAGNAGNIEWGEAILFSGAHQRAERDRIRRYLAQRWTTGQSLFVGNQ